MNILHTEELDKIIDSAADLFLKNGIGKTSIKEIAVAAECGEASVYRYYKTKDNIAIMAATLLSERLLKEEYDFSEKKSGYEKLESFYLTYGKIFTENPGYYRFLSELDSVYMKNYSKENIEEYEKSVEKYHLLYLDAYKEGLEDGSVKEISDIDMFYYSSAHAILNLCKFLSVSVSPFEHDKSNVPMLEIHTLCKMILNNIQKNQ